MKNIQKIILGLLFSSQIFAQTDPKTGYTNVEYLISKHPEIKKISDELEKQRKHYDTAYQSKVKEFQDKYTAYQKAVATMPEIIKKDKEKELETMQASIQELQKNAEKDMQNKQGALIQPLYVKVYSAIQAVAEENGYKFIFNTGDSNQARNLIVAPADGDISEMVLKKLGATDTKEKEKAKEATAAAKKEVKVLKEDKGATEVKTEKAGNNAVKKATTSNTKATPKKKK